MKREELRRLIYGYVNEICHYGQMQVFATSYYQKNYFQQLIDERVDELITIIEGKGLVGYQMEPSDGEDENINNEFEEDLPLFTVEELAQFNGANGQPAYVAVNGIVYDLSNVGRWRGGRHFGLIAGQDLSAQFNNCHQTSIERLERLPIVGRMDSEE